VGVHTFTLIHTIKNPGKKVQAGYKIGHLFLSIFEKSAIEFFEKVNLLEYRAKCQKNNSNIVSIIFI
jgi:hypothetical protein